MRRRRTAGRVLVALVAGTLLFSACGVKGPPRPPQPTRDAPRADAGPATDGGK